MTSKLNILAAATLLAIGASNVAMAQYACPPGYAYAGGVCPTGRAGRIWESCLGRGVRYAVRRRKWLLGCRSNRRRCRWRSRYCGRYAFRHRQHDHAGGASAGTVPVPRGLRGLLRRMLSRPVDRARLAADTG